MTQLRAILALILGLLVLPGAAEAQPKETSAWTVESLSDEGGTVYDLKTGRWTATNNVLVTYEGAVLTADQASVEMNSGEVVADGHVRIQRDEQIWVSDHLIYNFKTRQIQSQQFRTGKAPVFATGIGLHGELTNKVYVATNAMITSDDISHPAFQVRAKYIKIIPGQKIEAHNAVLYLEGVPVFYFPYYSRNLGERANNFNFVPGYRSSDGPFLLTKYTWFLNEQLDGNVHVDYRERRGPGVGPDLNYHLGRWGDGSAKYYYTHDKDPSASVNGADVPEDRQNVDFAYQANPATNLFVKSRVRWQSDTNIVRDFLESEYRDNPKPNTYFDINRFWQNFSLDTYVEPRLNDFLETVERLPEVRLTGFRQELGASPIYYESQSSMGYYERLFAETNSFSVSSNYSAARADTFHQLLLPETFFGWLNFTPRVGGRFTYYSEASGTGATTSQVNRGVFNTGAELSFKASKTWPEFQSSLLEADGLRHIIEPSVDYVYIPSPNYHPSQVPQFDSELPSLRLLPIDFPDYNDIDAIDSQDVVRLGLFNKFQTKRSGVVANLIKWDVYTDWRLQTHTNQTKFSDIYSDLLFRPRSWLSVESMTRYDSEDGLFRMAYHALTLQPNDVWSWTIGHFYLHDDNLTPLTGLGEGNNLITSTLFYRLNDNWGFKAYHRFEARDGKMEEQAYSIYRDMRSWTAALTFRALENTTGPTDYTVAFTFSLKAFPRYGLGTDIVKPYSLLGS